jgi:hypothetical protein
MKRPVLAIFLCLVAALGATAQCPSNDNLSGPPCCQPTATNVPVFPTMTLNGLGACVRDCGVESQFNTVTVLSPMQVLCDYWFINLTITAPPAVSIISQTLVAKYDRTWTEYPVAGAAPLQVWRFLVNGDLVYSSPTTAAGGCPVPLSALPPYNLPVHYIGNVDYAFDCATGAWQVAYTLTHFCPTESHAPFSARPIAAAAGWPKRTYHFVGPANFVFGLCPAPAGPIVADTTRTSFGLSNPALPYTCLRETQVVQGILQNVQQNCVCFDPTPIGPPPRYTHQNLNATETCLGGAVAPIASVPVPLPALFTGLRALTIGAWTPVATQTYPGTKCISVYLGVLNSPGLCTLATPVIGTHVVSGVGTTGGNPSRLFDTPLPFLAPLQFLDLHNMLIFTPPFSFTPGFGALFASERVWDFNMP